MEVRPSTWPPVASIVPTVAHDDTTVYAEAGCPVWGRASTASAARASPLNGARDEWCGKGTDAEPRITSLDRAITDASNGRREFSSEIARAGRAAARDRGAARTPPPPSRMTAPVMRPEPEALPSVVARTEQSEIQRTLGQDPNRIPDSRRRGRASRLAIG